MEALEEAQRQYLRRDDDSSWRLRHSVAVRAPIAAFWSAARTSEMSASGEDDAPGVSFGVYTTIFHRIYTVLLEEWDPSVDAFSELLAADWASDLPAGAKHLTHEALGDALFDVADAW